MCTAHEQVYHAGRADSVHRVFVVQPELLKPRRDPAEMYVASTWRKTSECASKNFNFEPPQSTFRKELRTTPNSLDSAELAATCRSSDGADFHDLRSLDNLRGLEACVGRAVA
jgi:hypothetical protein